MAIGQIQNRCSKKYDYSQPNQLSRYYKAPICKEKSYSPKSTDAFMPSTQTTSDDLSQDLLKQYTIKNQLLSQQVKEYRTLVNNLEFKINELTEENSHLTKIVEERTKQKVGHMMHIQKQNALRKGLNLSLITEQSQSEQVIELREVWDILNRFSQKYSSNQWLDKQFVLTQLQETIIRMKQMKSFTQSLWKMKSKVEADGDTSLTGLWQWLKKVIYNYSDLLSYRKSTNLTQSQLIRKHQ